MLTRPSAGYFKFWFGPEQRFSFDLINDIKAAVPPEDRSYDANTREWTIKELHYHVVRELHDKYYAIPNHDLFED